jgi:ubiquinone/menaquinone biosynthesis C-methylase UbiE
MMTASSPPKPGSLWVNQDIVNLLKVRVRTFYNTDYFERVVLPLLAVPERGRVLDVGCGYGGLSLILAEMRPDLQVTGIDLEPQAVANATRSATERGFANLTFEQGDAHRLNYADEQFEAVVCQTVLTHVPKPETVVREMARALKPGGVFMAAEYSNAGPVTAFINVEDEKRDSAWLERFFRLSLTRIRGKKALGRGDDHLGVRVPCLAAAAGLDVFDVRLNDRAIHVLPPYRHAKQMDYLALLKAYYAPDPQRKGLAEEQELFAAAGGTAEDARWLYDAVDTGSIRQAIADGTLTQISAFMLFLTFARKPDAAPQ